MYSHDLSELLKLAELEDDLDTTMRRSRALTENWIIVQNWKVESRYETSGLNGTDMFTAVSSADGVLPWIQRRW